MKCKFSLNSTQLFLMRRSSLFLSVSESVLVNPFANDNSCFILPFWRQHLKIQERDVKETPLAPSTGAHYKPRHILNKAPVEFI